MGMSERDRFDAWAEHLLKYRDLKKMTKAEALHFLAGELRRTDKDAREDIQSRLRDLLNVPSKDEMPSGLKFD
jgi:hypothetical protein